MGQQLQNKIISEIGENMQIYRIILGLNIPSGAKAENIAKTTFAKLGIAKPSRKRKRISGPKNQIKGEKGEKE